MLYVMTTYLKVRRTIMNPDDEFNGDSQLERRSGIDAFNIDSRPICCPNLCLNWDINREMYLSTEEWTSFTLGYYSCWVNDIDAFFCLFSEICLSRLLGQSKIYRLCCKKLTVCVHIRAWIVTMWLSELKIFIVYIKRLFLESLFAYWLQTRLLQSFNSLHKKKDPVNLPCSNTDRQSIVYNSNSFGVFITRTRDPKPKNLREVFGCDFFTGP